jgi:hypothetical protein
MLLAIGFLTTPSQATGVSLSEFWAWVRYLHAVSSDTDLRITADFANLDAHQKTILSDDFGMGAPMCWLAQRLRLGPVCDGRYFLDRIAPALGIGSLGTAKRGPQKAPDFVAQDVRGVWHVIECKGTQSGAAYREKQLGEAGPPPTGAISQKRTILFPANHTGQRLACGLSIAVENGPGRSNLRIIDPVENETIEIGHDKLLYAEDAAIRSVMAKSLRLAGFDVASWATSAPMGRYPNSRPTRGRSERDRSQFVEDRTRQATAELSARGTRARIDVGAEKYLGRDVNLSLPRVLDVSGQQIRSVRIRQGVNERVLDELAGRPTIEAPLPEADVAWDDELGTIELSSDQRNAQLLIGSAFVFDIELLGP